jgi:hypothetical protein
MFKKGTRVKIVDKNLQSFNMIGTYVGMKADNSAYKIYLDEKVGKGVHLVCIKDSASFIPIKEDNESVISDYIKHRLFAIEQELDNLKLMLY